MGILFHYGYIRLYNPLLKEEVLMKNITDPEKYANVLRSTLGISNGKIIPSHSLNNDS